eukprot:330594-Chlamydomonas_euryale.AAC.1
MGGPAVPRAPAGACSGRGPTKACHAAGTGGRTAVRSHTPPERRLFEPSLRCPPPAWSSRGGLSRHSAAQ